MTLLEALNLLQLAAILIFSRGRNGSEKEE